MRHRIRLGLALAAALTVISASAAQANEWCGYATTDNAVVECGYTTASDCESAVGKGGMCFVDPDMARNFSARNSSLMRPAPRQPQTSAKIPAHG